MLFELAIADAYGASFEFTKPEFIKENNNLCYITHPSRPHENIKKGYYTDDTQMSIAIARLMCSSVKPEHYNHIDFSDAFITAFKRDPRKGYGKRIQTALESNRCIHKYQDYTSFMIDLNPLVSTANGSVMRALPVGCLSDINLVKRTAVIQGTVTHQSIEAIESSIIASLAAHALWYRKCTKETLIDWLVLNRDNRPVPIRHRDDMTPVGCVAVDTIAAAISLVVNGNSLTEIMHKAVSFGGDTDSVAAVAVGLASLADNVKKDLPLRLKRGLENTRFGKDHLRRLDSLMLKRFPRDKAVFNGEVKLGIWKGK